MLLGKVGDIYDVVGDGQKKIVIITTRGTKKTPWSLDMHKMAFKHMQQAFINLSYMTIILSVYNNNAQKSLEFFVMKSPTINDVTSSQCVCLDAKKALMKM